MKPSRPPATIAPELPVIASMTFTRDDRTLLGDDPTKVARKLHEAGADVIGVNCSGGPNQILRILKQMRQAVPDGRFSVMPNAGWPEQVGGRIMYPAAPEYFGDYALAFWQAGAHVIGGCCGTTPEHMPSCARPSKMLHPARRRTASAWRLLKREDPVRRHAAHRLGRKIGRRKVRLRRRDGSPARVVHPQAAGRRQPAQGSRRGCDQRRGQPDGTHAHESLGGVPPGAGEWASKPCCISPPAGVTCCACRATCWPRMPWAYAMSSWSWATPPPLATTRKPWTIMTWCPPV